jgi:hypothetical protein
MKAWFKAVLARFAIWRAENARAHAQARVSPCCSAPPPGAGKSVGNKT